MVGSPPLPFASPDFVPPLPGVEGITVVVGGREHFFLEAQPGYKPEDGADFTVTLYQIGYTANTNGGMRGFLSTSCSSLDKKAILQGPCLAQWRVSYLKAHACQAF